MSVQLVNNYYVTLHNSFAAIVLNKTSIKGNWCSQSRQRNANSQSDLCEKENATGA